MWQLSLWVILFQQILYLQEAITNLTAPLGDNDTVTLDDICFKPLAPDNNYCTINSIVQYFQVRMFPHIIRVPCMNMCVSCNNWNKILPAVAKNWNRKLPVVAKTSCVH